MRRDDKQQFRAVLLEVCAAEQRAKYRQFAQHRQGTQAAALAIAYQATDGETLSVI